MVGSSKSFVRSEYRDITIFQTVKSLRTGYLVYEVPVDVENVGSIFNGFHYMTVPDFVEKCF
jgi:hypothetical protein